MSCVDCPSCTAASTALNPSQPPETSRRVSRSSAADNTAPIGLAMFFLSSGGADPCTGSNSEVRPGLNIAGRRHSQSALQRPADVGDDVATELLVRLPEHQGIRPAACTSSSWSRRS